MQILTFDSIQISFVLTSSQRNIFIFKLCGFEELERLLNYDLQQRRKIFQRIVLSGEVFAEIYWIYLKG
jgi:hypothetical protein